MSFQGFADDQRSFFKQLAKHPTREWFQEHKAEYVEGWHAPMLALLADVRERVDDAFPYCELAEPKVFRIQRDTRFSKDKTPYKTHVAGVLMARGAGATSVLEQPAALYLNVGVGGGDMGELTAHGQYAMAPAQLERYRAALLDPRRGEEIASLVRGLVKAGFRVGAAETLKKVPRGVDPEHPHADLLRHKGLAVMGPAVPDALLTSRKLVDHLAKQTKKAAPLVSLLVEITAV
jgi:uncharacterized protein (TIGR02453 family)